MPNDADPAYHPFVRRIVRAMRLYCPVRKGATLLLAVSGGADSVALLRALHLLAGKGGREWTLHIAHVHHHLHDQAASHARFVEQLAGAFDLPMHQLAVHPAQEAGNVEAAARKMRYAALAELAKRIHADAVVTAHHADDQLETLLMRLVRGSGVSGMAGLRWDRAVPEQPTCRLIRPMLMVDRAMVEGFLCLLDQEVCEDPTNADTDRWRNRLRRDVLPVLRALRPQAAFHATQSADAFAAARELLREQARQIVWELVNDEQGRESWQCSREVLRASSQVVVSESIRQKLRALGIHMDRLSQPTMQAVVRSICDGSGHPRQFALQGGVAIYISRKSVHISK